jgi:Cu/Ag efflux pump CusA
MKDRMRAVLAVVMKDPAVAAANAYIGPGGPAVNDGRVFITLKPYGHRPGVDQVMERLEKALQPVYGITLYMQAAQDITIGARVSKTQYQYTLVDVDIDELDHWAPILFNKLKTLPQLTDVASDQQSTGRVMKVEIDRQLAQQLGINPSVVDSILYDAFGQRVAARIYTRLNQYFVILEVEPDFQLGPNALSRIYATSSSGKEVPLSEFAKITSTVAPIAVNHQGQFPSVTLSFNLPPKVSIGAAVTAIQQAAKELHLPASIATSFQGSAEAFQDSLSSTPILILAALIAVYIILGMLYESTIHPIIDHLDLAVGRARGALDLDAVRHAARRYRHYWDHPLNRHRQEERHHAGRLRAGGSARARARHRGRDPRGGPSALSPYSDDDDVRSARRRPADARHRHRVGNPPAFGLRNRRRSPSLAAADIVHHARRLYIHGSPRPPAEPTPPGRPR